MARAIYLLSRLTSLFRMVLVVLSWGLNEHVCQGRREENFSEFYLILWLGSGIHWPLFVAEDGLEITAYNFHPSSAALSVGATMLSSQGQPGSQKALSYPPNLIKR